MKFLPYTFAFLLWLLSYAGVAQVPTVTEKFTSRDTLRVHSLYADLSLLFMVSDDEMENYTDFHLQDRAHLRYVFGRSDVDLLFTQDIERDNDGALSYNNYLALSGGIGKYQSVGEGLVGFRRLYPEAIFIFQNNSYRGLASRFQAGALLYPWTLHLSRFKLNIAVGGVYDWSKWRVNDENKIAACSPEMQEKIRFINSRISLQGNMYQLHNEFRPVLVLDARLLLNDVLQLRLSTSYQQSLVSPYSREIIDAYPELGKVYPYLLSRLEANTRIFKSLSFQTTLTVDYENNNLALYDSSWQYSLMFGLSFHLHGRKL
ncbi:MAG: hypothetical protein LBR65_02690 [Culturomica sp.]|jgi:hypothetical protein|nr:hypothetical protein [Culturomica sp.]